MVPVGLPHVLDAHVRAGAGRVDELAVADVDADVRERAPEGVEEDEIPGTQFLASDTHQPRVVGLIVDPARQDEAEADLEDVAREAAAIKALDPTAAAGSVPGATTAVPKRSITARAAGLPGARAWRASTSASSRGKP